MADFRKWLLVLLALGLMAGFASAQTGIITGSNGGTLTCGLQNTVTPQLRQEGFTEQTGDILIACTGGQVLAPGSQIPTTDITLFYNVPAVTSRLLASGGVSEALLLIDEPANGSTASVSTGPGTLNPQVLCNTPLVGAGANGCTEFVGANGAAVTAAGGTSTGANVFQGVVSGNTVTFFGIPVLPPVTNGFSRVFRITNVRVNANGAGGGAAGGPGQVNASISTNPPSLLGLTNANPIVGFIQPSLTTSVGSAGTFFQCASQNGLAGFFNFKELFPTAFKTRVDGRLGGAPNNFTSAVNQNIPGAGYNSESGLIMNGGAFPAANSSVTGGGFTAGLADFGTRLKIIFNNIPSGVVLTVSTTNVFGTNAANFAPPVFPGGGTLSASTSPYGNSQGTSFAVLLSSETASDGTGSLPLATSTTTFGFNGTSAVSFTSQGNPIVVVYEVINTQPTTNETFTFAAGISFSNVSQTFPPAPATGTATLTYAPTPTNGAFSASSAGTAALTFPIPRFADTSTGSSTFFTINLCQTTLLFPYITTVTGFDTGIVIANTSTDPFKTTPQSGTCALNWFQGSNNPAVTTTPVIASGTIYTNNASATGLAGQGFSGYMIAVCNFQLAHGVAEVMDVGIQHLLSAYLALVITTNQGSRNIGANGTPENLNN